MVSFNLRIFKSWQLQYGWAPGKFRLLPGIGRARYRWLYTVSDRTFTSGDVDLRAYLFIDHCLASFSFLNFMVGLDREIILIAKFSWSMVNVLHVNNSYIPQMEQHVASFPGPVRLSLAVRNSCRGKFRTASNERAGPILYCKRRTRRAWERG